MKGMTDKSHDMIGSSLSAVNRQFVHIGTVDESTHELAHRLEL